MSIPKIIHYCWFGRNPKPKLAEKCIRSWKKYCPDYRIIEWNEDNYNISEAPLYVRQAYEAKRWAFVTDYIRLQVVYENGGIYLDTDVEIKKSLDDLLSHGGYFGFENEKNIATGLGFGSVQGHTLLKELMDDYQDIKFIREDGSMDLEPCPSRNTKIFLRHGLQQNNAKQIICDNILILPTEYLCPIDFATNTHRFSENTYSVHWFDASWQTESEKKDAQKWKQSVIREKRRKKMAEICRKTGVAVFGRERYEKIKSFLKRLWLGC